MAMTRSVYVLGGNGTGKSTFTAKLLANLGWQLGPLEDLWRVPNARGSLVTLRGHRAGDAVYLGVMREQFPGTDGLDRASSIAAAAWIGTEPLPAAVLAEGATLATTRFLTALRDRTDLLLLHLYCSDAERERRFAERGSEQAWVFAKTTAGRATTMVDRIGGAILRVDTENPTAWDIGLDLAECHLAESWEVD